MVICGTIIFSSADCGLSYKHAMTSSIASAKPGRSLSKIMINTSKAKTGFDLFKIKLILIQPVFYGPRTSEILSQDPTRGGLRV